MMQEQGDMLRPLLEYLAHHQLTGPELWHAWDISRIAGGANNLLFRATSEHGDFAIKFTIRDSRNRADREYGALCALAQLGLPIAPEPVLLDRDSYPQPVVVQKWLEGDIMRTPPSTENDWNKLLQHLSTIHTVTPAVTSTRLANAVLNANSVDACKALVLQQMTFLPPEAQPALLQSLVSRLETSLVESWPGPPTSLCRVDPNSSNFVRRDGPWASVDWENSGWGDPAFEIADLMAHPAYMNVPKARWEWVVDRYSRLVQDMGAAIRIGVYYKTMLVWWVVRFARQLYEVPRGKTDGWLIDLQIGSRRYGLSTNTTLTWHKC